MDTVDYTDYRRNYNTRYTAARFRHDFLISGYSVGPIEYDPEGGIYWFEAIPS